MVEKPKKSQYGINLSVQRKIGLKKAKKGTTYGGIYNMATLLLVVEIILKHVFSFAILEFIYKMTFSNCTSCYI